LDALWWAYLYCSAGHLHSIQQHCGMPYFGFGALGAVAGATRRRCRRCYTTAFAMSAPQPDNPGRIVRFGVFELDLEAGELRRNGIKLHLQEQPFQVLAMLLERAGKIVAREELRQKLWKEDTFVDFDHSLNTAVNKLREVLGDSASRPQYVETLARRGYRFMAPIRMETSGGSDWAQARAAISNSLEGSPATAKRRSVSAVSSESTALHPELEVPIPPRGLTRGLFALVQIMYLAFYICGLSRLHAVEEVADWFLPARSATAMVAVVMVTAGAGIPLRCFLISAAGFDYRRLGEKFRQMFPLILALDLLWAVAPFLLMQKIGMGAAFAATAALLYVPFGERTLIRLAYTNAGTV
jgi:cholera toxin transcriptional activator